MEGNFTAAEVMVAEIAVRARMPSRRRDGNDEFFMVYYFGFPE
jgi:hypothetical protein